MWYTDKQAVVDGFETTFVFRISELDSFGGAVGLCFVLQ